VTTVTVVPVDLRLTLIALAAALAGASSCSSTTGPRTSATESGLAQAKAACIAYANTNRHQTTITARATTIRRERALHEAAQAAARVASWARLGRDMQRAFEHLHDSALAQNSGRPVETAAELQAYFAADERVAQDCRIAGYDLGPLRP